MTFGHLSEVIGRRRGMIAARVLSLATIPVRASAGLLAMMAAGGVVLDAGMQCAGVLIPGRLYELSADQTLCPLLCSACELGILIVAPVNNLDYTLRARSGYAWALDG